MYEEKGAHEGEGGIFLDMMADVQAHNLADFKRVVGGSWQCVSKVMDLCDVLLNALPASGQRMHEERVRALDALLHAAKRAGSAGTLSLARGQWLEAQPQFRRYVECFGFARIAWARKDDAVLWFKGVQSADAYEAYRGRFAALLPRALKELHRSLRDAHGDFSKGTHSSFLSIRHAMTDGGDDSTLELTFAYFDLGRPEETAGYVELFLETVRVLLMCQETFAVRTFGAKRWKPSWEHWVAVRTPVVKEWFALEEALRRSVGLPIRLVESEQDGQGGEGTATR